MNIKKSNLFARYYNWFYGAYPNDLCSFFWGTLFIVLFPIISIPGKVIAPFTDFGESTFSKVLSGVLFWIGYVAMIAVGHGLLNRLGYLGATWYSLLIYAPLLGTLTLMLGLALIIAVIGRNEEIGVVLQKNLKSKHS